MVSLEDFERLARYQAKELTADEERTLEAQLASDTALAQALRQLQMLDEVARELPLATLGPEAVDVLVARALPKRSSRVWLAAAGLVLIASAALLLKPGPSARFDVVVGEVTVDGRSVHVGDEVHEGALIITGVSSVASIDRGLLVASSSQVRLVADVLELQDGAVVARGEDVHLSLGRRTFIVNGEAILSREPFVEALRETANLTPEHLVNLKRMTLGGVVLGGAVALYVLNGSVKIEESGRGEVVHAPNRWFANGAQASHVHSDLARDGGAAVTTVNETFDGLLELHVLERGRPVAGAKVKLYERGQLSHATGKLEWRASPTIGETNAAGVVLLGANPGAYYAAVRASGWPITLQEVHRPTGQPKTIVTIALEPGSKVSGRTESAVTHQPVVPASILLRPRSTPEAEAFTVDVDANGAFTLESVSPGWYGLEATAPGYGKAWQGVRVPSTEPLKVVFRGSGFVEGFVKLEDGGVAAGAKVMLTGEETSETEASASGSFSIEAPAGVWRAQAHLGALVGVGAGQFSVHSGETTSTLIVLHGSSLLTGRVFSADAGVERAVVTVSPHRGAGELARAETGLNGEYRIPMPPGVYDVEAVSLDARTAEDGVHIGHGETKLDLRIPRLGSIVGKVVDESGKPLDDVRLEGMPPGQRDLKRTTVSVAGKFSFRNVQAGLFQVVALPGARAVGISKLVTVEPEAVAELELVVEPLEFIEGKVNWKCAGPAEPVTISAYPIDRATWTSVRQTLPVGESRFRMEVSPGRYNLSAYNSSSSCTASAKVDTKKPAPLTLDLVTNNLLFEVQVKDADGHPVSYAVMTVSTSDESLVSTSQSDENGIFRFEDFGSTRKHEVYKVAASKGGRVGRSGPILPGAKSVTVTLEKGPRLDVHIEGAPEGSRSRVEVVTLPDFAFADSLVTTSSSLALESVPTGRVHITVRNDARVGEGNVVVKAGENAALTVRLSEGGTVKGRLVNLEGKPVAGWVNLKATEEEAGDAITVDDSGFFEIRPVTAGDYVLLTPGEKTKRPLTVKAGAVVDLGEVIVKR